MIEIKAIKRDKHRKRARLSSHIELLLTPVFPRKRNRDIRESGKHVLMSEHRRLLPPLRNNSEMNAQLRLTNEAIRRKILRQFSRAIFWENIKKRMKSAPQSYGWILFFEDTMRLINSVADWWQASRTLSKQTWELERWRSHFETQGIIIIVFI